MGVFVGGVVVIMLMSDLTNEVGLNVKQVRLKVVLLNELLIVMSLISLVLSIVGPMTVSTLDKAAEKSELQETKLWPKTRGNQTFLSGSEVLVEVEEAKISIYHGADKGSSQNKSLTR